MKVQEILQEVLVRPQKDRTQKRINTAAPRRGRKTSRDVTPNSLNITPGLCIDTTRALLQATKPNIPLPDRMRGKGGRKTGRLDRSKRDCVPRSQKLSMPLRDHARGVRLLLDRRLRTCGKANHDLPCRRAPSTLLTLGSTGDSSRIVLRWGST